MNERPPTPFELKVLRRVQQYSRVFEGNKQIAISMAFKRLVKAGYCGKYGYVCYLTEKGEAYLASLDAGSKA